MFAEIKSHIENRFFFLSPYFMKHILNIEKREQNYNIFYTAV